MDKEELNTENTTEMLPEKIEHKEKSGYMQVKDMLDTLHGYCMDYTKLSFDFIHDNKDLVKDIVKISCKTAMVVSIAAASVSIAKAVSKKD